MPRGNPSSFNFYTCPNCSALYEVVKVEAGPATDREITCPVCDAPLAGREGEFVLKYFLLRKAIQPRRKAKKNTAG
jgi:transcription initiation factor IIE alpha subunit